MAQLGNLDSGEKLELSSGAEEKSDQVGRSPEEPGDFTAASHQPSLSLVSLSAQSPFLPFWVPSPFLRARVPPFCVTGRGFCEQF